MNHSKFLIPNSELMNNVYHILSHSAERWPLRTALIDEYGTLDYQSLSSDVEKVKHQLEMLGVRAGEGVGVMARNGRSLIIAAFAALGRGAAVMPIYHQLKPAELAEMLEKAPLHAIIDDASGIRPLIAPGHPLELRGAPPLRFTRTALSPETPIAPHVPDAAFARFTSGTTGAAKGVVLSHRGVLERIEAANRGLNLTCEDTVIWVLPMAFHFFVSIILYLNVGAAIAVCADHLAESVLDDAARHRGTFLYAAPLHYRLLAADRSGRPMPTLRCAMSVSSRLHSQTAHSFLKRYGLPVTQAYGIIEVGLPVMNLTHARVHPESIGRPLPDYDVALMDQEMRPVAEGEIGHLCLRGPGMFEAYLNPPVPRADVLRHGWFLTGDLARRGAEGLITIVGRAKSLINVAGHKVFPEEVAAVLDLHPAVAKSRVTSRPHPQLGEVVSAQVQLIHDAPSPSLSAGLIDFCRERLSSYKVPALIEFTGEIKETPSGKVRHG